MRGSKEEGLAVLWPQAWPGHLPSQTPLLTTWSQYSTDPGQMLLRYYQGGVYVGKVPRSVTRSAHGRGKGTIKEKLGVFCNSFWKTL